MIDPRESGRPEFVSSATDIRLGVLTCKVGVIVISDVESLLNMTIRETLSKLAGTN